MPEELILEIFSFLAIPDRSNYLNLVSKEFNTLEKDAGRYVFLELSHARQLPAILNKYTDLTGVGVKCMKGFSDKIAHAISPYSCLESLDLRENPLEGRDGVFSELGLVALLNHKRLHSLELDNESEDSPVIKGGIFEPTGLFPNLTTLSVQVSNSGLLKMASNKEQDSLKENPVMKGLEVVDFSNSLDITDYGLIPFLRCQNWLRSLDLSMCSQVTDRSLLHLPAGLESLLLSNCNITLRGVRSLERLTNLETLDLPEFSLEELEPALNWLQSLTTLFLTCSNIDRNVVLRIAAQLKNLESITLEASEDIPDGQEAEEEHHGCYLISRGPGNKIELEKR